MSAARQSFFGSASLLKCEDVMESAYKSRDRLMISPLGRSAWKESSQLGEIPIPELRRQDTKNRQNSWDDLEEEDKTWFEYTNKKIQDATNDFYEEALERGIAKESARFLLPLSTKTRMYMNGTVRSWIHYIKLRTDPSTQKEHQDIANEIKGIFREELPIISEALEWNECS